MNPFEILQKPRIQLSIADELALSFWLIGACLAIALAFYAIVWLWLGRRK